MKSRAETGAILSAPMIGRGGLNPSRSAFNEGVSVPRAEWQKLAARNPALDSADRKERSEAITREILSGSLAPYRRR